ncbi:porin [uncultured Thiodictyon sp.]|uniref:porin n=1 Tax=uncultured Thiodictyon sp. TaxID=1846217 RepID=UPI0025E8B73D|nr:porin [uncultured Thiodictyon sp.]
MNKKLLTLAVATALAVPAYTASAEAILYGKVNVSLDYINVSQNATYFRPGNTVSPLFNAASFFYGTGGQNTAPNAVAQAAQQVALQTQLGGLPIVNGGVFLPGGIGTQGLTQSRVVSAAAVTTLSTQYNNTYASIYNSQIRAGATAANAATVAAAGAAQYGNPNTGTQWGAGQEVINLTSQQLANVTAAENTGWAAVQAGGFGNIYGGAIALNTYTQGQVANLQNAIKANSINAVQTAQANAQILALVGANGKGGYAAAALRASSLASIRAGQKYNGWGLDTSNPINGPASRVGVKGSEDLGNGLKAIYQIEIGVDISNANRDYSLTTGNRGGTAGVGTSVSPSGFSFRNTFVGLTGDWGTVMLGRYDTPLKLSTARLDLFADTLADYNSTVGFQDIRADNTIAFISPNFSGFQLAMAAVPQNASTPILLNGLPDNKASNFAGAYSMAATYKNGPFYGSVAYEALGKSNFAADNPYYQFTFQNKTAKDDTKVRIGLGLLDWNGFTLTGIYEQRNNINGAPVKSNGNFLQFQGAYAFGSNTVKVAWGRADLSRCADPNLVGFRFTCQAGVVGQYLAGSGAPLMDQKRKEVFSVGYDYNFSKRTAAYALFTQTTDKVSGVGGGNGNWNGFSVGMTHSF